MSALLAALFVLAQPPGTIPPPPPVPPFPPPAPAHTHEDAVVLEAAAVLREVQAAPDRGIPHHLLKEAKGVVITPGLKKVGFLVEGHIGHGIAVVRRADGSWSPPVFCKMTGAGFGAQAGVESQDLVLVCRSDRSMAWLSRGADFTLDVNAGVAAGPVGREAKAGTNVRLDAEILSYSRARGLFAGVAVSGGKLRVENGADASYYRAPGIPVRDILRGENLPIPASALKFEQTLSEASKAPPVVIIGQPKPPGPR